MDDLRDAEAVVDSRAGDVDAGRSVDLPEEDPGDTGRGARGGDAASRSGADTLDAVLRRAVSEQLTEQRLIREALTDLDRRLGTLEQLVSERLTDTETAAGDRIDRFERAVSERMAAFEAVLKRIVDRLTGAEERISEGLGHNDRVTRMQIDALRPALEAAAERAASDVDGSLEILARAVERLGEGVDERLGAVEERLGSELGAVEERLGSELGAVEERLGSVGSKIDSTAGQIERRVSHVEGGLEEAVQRLAEAIARSERVTEAHLEALRPTVEAAVLTTVNPELDRALEALREALADTGRRVQRDVNGLAYLIRRQGRSVDGFEPVDDATEPVDDAPAPVDDATEPDRETGVQSKKRRRERPLRARRATA